jgi:hypothetical protein
MNLIRKFVLAKVFLLVQALPSIAGTYEMDQGGHFARLDFVSRSCHEFIEIDEVKAAEISKRINKIGNSPGAEDFEWAFRTVMDIEGNSLARAKPSTKQTLCGEYVRILNDAYGNDNPVSSIVKP